VATKPKPKKGDIYQPRSGKNIEDRQIEITSTRQGRVHFLRNGKKGSIALSTLTKSYTAVWPRVPESPSRTKPKPKKAKAKAKAKATVPKPESAITDAQAVHDERKAREQRDQVVKLMADGKDVPPELAEVVEPIDESYQEDRFVVDEKVSFIDWRFTIVAIEIATAFVVIGVVLAVFAVLGIWPF